MGKITVLLPDEEYWRFDAYCKAKGFKKSTLIARLIREYLAREGDEAARSLPRAGKGRGRAATAREGTAGT